MKFAELVKRGFEKVQKPVAIAILEATFLALPLFYRPALAEDKPAKDDVYVEDTVSKDSSTSRLELLTPEGKKYFVAQHIHDNTGFDSTEFALKKDMDLKLFKGNMQLYGTESGNSSGKTDCDKTALGLNGKLGDYLIFGGTLERKIAPTKTGSEDQNLRILYVGKEFSTGLGSLTAKIGAGDINNVGQQQASLGLFKTGEYFFGVGGKQDETDSQTNWIMRQLPAKKGEDSGIELRGNKNYAGNSQFKFTYATKNSFGASGFTDIDDNGMNDLSVSLTEFRIPPDFTYGNFVLVGKMNDNKDGSKNYMFNAYKSIGDIGFAKSVTFGAGMTIDDVVGKNKQSDYEMIDMGLGPVRAYFERTKSEGSKPETCFILYFNLSDLIGK